MPAPAVEGNVLAAVSTLSSVERVLALQGAMYQSDLFAPDEAARALQTATEIAGVVPLRRLALRRDFDGLADACAAVFADVAALEDRSR